jgi:hypothetical protein
MDISEQQSVWQYLNVFSIYQDRLPDNCGDRTPEELFDIINDTLGGSRYTEYRLNKMTDNAAAYEETLEKRYVTFKIADSTVYIRIPDFLDSSFLFFIDRISFLELYENIVIDLRNNGGGSIDICDYIVSEFLPFNSGDIKFKYRAYNRKELKGRTVDWEIQRTVNRNPKLHRKNIAVLMNRNSASASEILISALKDREDRPNAGAILIGDTTYGKGIGQSLLPRLGRKRLSITSIQIRGLTDRTGDYHRKGIYPDPLENETLKTEAQYSYDPYLYYAVMSLEPSASPILVYNTIRDNLAGLPKTSSIAKKAPIGAYFLLEDPLND